jgi:hypothetical protein
MTEGPLCPLYFYVWWAAEKKEVAMKPFNVRNLIIGVGLSLALGMTVPMVQAETLLLPTQGKPVFIKFLGGTVEDIDHVALKLTIQTEIGKKESFSVATAEVIQGLMKGDQVSIELDDHGKVLNVVKNNSLPAPAPEPRG